MSDEYRDPLAAAHARIEQLERQNRALERRVGDQPATQTDLDLLRLEQQLVNLDAAWRRRARRIGGLPDARWDRFQTNLLYAIAAAFALVAPIAAFASHRGPVLGIVFGGIALVIGAVALTLSHAMARARTQHEAARAGVLKQIEVLRGVPVEARVRVAEAAEAVAARHGGDEDAGSDGDDVTVSQAGQNQLRRG
jgi:hypothetical protein